MIRLSFFNLFRRKSRTFLSVLGIAIGVAAIIGLISVVDGVYNEYASVISGLQGIWVWEKDVIDQTLSKVDADTENKISSVQGIRVVLPELWIPPSTIDGKPIGVGGEGLSIDAPLVYGVDISRYRKLRSNVWIGELEKGSMLKPGDEGFVVIGKSLAEDRDKFLGSSIKVNGKRFRVKGILKSETMGLGGIIFMSLSDARDVSDFPNDKVSCFYVELVNPAEDQVVAKKLGFILGEKFEIMSTSDMSELFSSVLGSFNIVIMLVGGLAAFVAGVGIVNTILMSVLERTREIGTLMATGWTAFNIMKMILYESMFLGIFGGIAGILLGIGVSEATKGIGLPSIVTPVVMLEAFLFALVLGLLAGVYPAFRASRLNPIEAIHSG